MKLRVLYDNKLWIEQIVKSATWSGEVATPHRTLSLTIFNTIDSDDELVDFELGKEIRFYVDKVGLFRGIIFKYDSDSEGNVTITAYDEAVYLTKNVDTQKFVNMSATGIVRSLCKSFDIPTGNITETGYIIPKLILRDKSLWDMIVTALTETRNQNSRKFFVYSREGKLFLREKKDSIVRWMIEDGVNLLSASRSQSIEDMRTAVKAIGGTEEKPVTFSTRDSSLIAKYGLMQHVENADTDATSSQIQQLAKTKLKEMGKVGETASLEALGNSEITSGSAVYVFESITDLVGGFYVNSDSHTFENGVHKMSLEISKTDDLPKMDYEAPTEKKSVKKAKTKIKSKTSSNSSGKRRTVKDVDKDVAELQAEIVRLKKGSGK